VAPLLQRYERRQARPALVTRSALVFVLIQAVVRLWPASAEICLAIPVFVNAGYGLAFIGSIAIGRPLAGVFAEEMLILPDEVKASRTHRRTFSSISFAWGSYMGLRSALRLGGPGAPGVDAFVAVGFVTGFPVTMALMSWSIWYGVRSFRRSEEWGPAIAALEEAALEAEFDADEDAPTQVCTANRCHSSGTPFSSPAVPPPGPPRLRHPPPPPPP